MDPKGLRARLEVLTGIAPSTGYLNAPTSKDFKQHFFQNGTWLGRFNGQDYFRSDGSPFGVGPRDQEDRKKFNVKDWQ